MADQEAKLAATLETEPEKPSMKAAISFIKRETKDEPPSHHRIKRTYAGHSEERDRIQICNRKDATLLAHLRAGHCRQLKAYENLMDPTTDPTCPLCQQEPQTLEHWLSCQGTERQRMEIFGTTEPRLELLSEEPAGAVTLAKGTLFGVSR